MPRRRGGGGCSRGGTRTPSRGKAGSPSFAGPGPKLWGRERGEKCPLHPDEAQVRKPEIVHVGFVAGKYPWDAPKAQAPKVKAVFGGRKESANYNGLLHVFQPLGVKGRPISGRTGDFLSPLSSARCGTHCPSAAPIAQCLPPPYEKSSLSPPGTGGTLSPSFRTPPCALRILRGASPGVREGQTAGPPRMSST